jgi:hypothetical protein
VETRTCCSSFSSDELAVGATVGLVESNASSDEALLGGIRTPAPPPCNQKLPPI